MHALPRLEVFNADTESAPFILARLGESSSAFVSCYLDTRAGQQACARFLDRKATQIRGTLRGIDRFHFDTAVEMIRRAMTTGWSTERQGMALFARGIAEDRQLTVFHSATPLDNRLIRYSVPEVLPLIALHQREPAFRMLLIERRRARLFESRLGAEVTQVSMDESEAIETMDLATDSTGIADADHSLVLPESLWCLNKTLGTSSLPLFVAGTGKALAGAAAWLPRRASDRLMGSLQVAPGDDIEHMLRKARMRLEVICQEECARLADAVASPQYPGLCSGLGYRATIEALRAANAEAVVIADWDSPGLGLPFEALIEICLMALRQGVRVVLADSIRLREAGGVGCLLRASEAGAAQHNTLDGSELERVA